MRTPSDVWRIEIVDKILLFIPCYNCSAQIGRVLAQVRDEVSQFINEVLVLDNGSTDGTVEAAKGAIAEFPVAVKVARNRANYNLGGSHKAAYSYAAQHYFTHVITLHGDDQGNLGDLLPLLRSGRHREHDACLGARFMHGAALKNYSQFRILGNLVFNFLFTVSVGRQISDMGSGLNLLAHSAYGDPRIRRLPDDLYFNPYLLLDLIDRGRSLHFFPISWREDDQISNVKMASQALETLRAPVLYMFARQAFRSRDFRAVKRDDYAFDVIG